MTRRPNMLRRLGDRWRTAADTSTEPDRVSSLTQQRCVVAATTAVGATLLGVSLATRPGSWRFYVLTGSVAATWLAGGLAAGPIPRGWTRKRAGHGLGRRPVFGPIAMGVGAFAAFYGCALVSRRIPLLRKAISGVLEYARWGTPRWVLLTTLANGVAEEVFFRGALYAVAGRVPVQASTAAYALTTVATRNPALILASLVMGTIFGLQRRNTGGIQAPMLTHLVWSALMVHFLPRLFPSAAIAEKGDSSP